MAPAANARAQGRIGVIQVTRAAPNNPATGSTIPGKKQFHEWYNLNNFNIFLNKKYYTYEIHLLEACFYVENLKPFEARKVSVISNGLKYIKTYLTIVHTRQPSRQRSQQPSMVRKLRGPLESSECQYQGLNFWQTQMWLILFFLKKCQNCSLFRKKYFLYIVGTYFIYINFSLTSLYIILRFS